MDENLQAELEETMRGAEVRLMAQLIARDVDMALLADMEQAMALKAALLSTVVGQNSNYIAAVLVSVIRKTRAMIQGMFSSPLDFAALDLDHEETEAPGFRWAHVIVRDILIEADAEAVGVYSNRLELSLQTADEETRGALLLHTFTLCGNLLAEVVKTRDEELREQYRKGEEGRDS